MAGSYDTSDALYDQANLAGKFREHLGDLRWFFNPEDERRDRYYKICRELRVNRDCQ